jgi:hypothetical protein
MAHGITGWDWAELLISTSSTIDSLKVARIFIPIVLFVNLIIERHKIILVEKAQFAEQM